MTDACRIWKYSVPLDGEWHTVFAPKGPVVSVADQGPELCLWLLLKSDYPLVERQFRWYATGEDFGGQNYYCGTVHSRGYVWHLIEKKVEE